MNADGRGAEEQSELQIADFKFQISDFKI